MASIVIVDLISVGLIRLYIYTELAGFVTNPTSSRSRDRYEISSDLGFRDVIEDRREYGITLFIL